MTIKVYKLENSTNLAVQAIPKKEQLLTPVAVNHYWAIDVSGSMYSELPKLRTQLKEKMFQLVKPSDTVTLVAFSGKNECFTLFENQLVAGAADKAAIVAAIDMYLTPRGLTGFKQPLEAMFVSIEKLKSKGVTSVFFMTDGYDNQWSEAEILGVCRKLASVADNAVVVEYGWYCNHSLLAKMAEALGGALLFSKEFGHYRDLFEAHLGATREKRVEVSLVCTSSQDWVFYISEGHVVVAECANGKCAVPESCEEIGFLTSDPSNQPEDSVCPLSWAALSALSQKGDTENIFKVLKHCGDVNLIQQFTNCFSKEDYITFQKDTTDAQFNQSLRYAKGFDRAAVPAEDAYTVLDLLEDLSADAENLFYPYHEKFDYQRISAATEQKSDELKFVVADKSAGYPINSLTWNESRPNVSIQIRVNGHVTLPDTRPNGVPSKFETFIYRNYTIVKDGIVHTRELPVSVSAETFKALQAQGLLKGEVWEKGTVYWLNFQKLPVINRKMVKTLDASEFFKLVLKLAQLKGTQKVLNDLKNKYAPRESKTFKLVYGEAATEWLKEHGLTDYSGFSPAVSVVKGADVYVGYELKTAIKGASSLPKVEDVKTAIASKKPLKISEELMRKGVEQAEAGLVAALSSKNPEEAAKKWIEEAAKSAVAEVRALNKRMSQIKFALIVGHMWFKEFSSTPGEASMAVSIPDVGAPATVSASLKEVEITI